MIMEREGIPSFIPTHSFLVLRCASTTPGADIIAGERRTCWPFMMTYCNFCGTVLPVSAKFCSKCGSTISLPVSSSPSAAQNPRQSSSPFSISSWLGPIIHLDTSNSGPTSREAYIPLTPAVLKRSVTMVLTSILAGAFLVWIVRFEFVLWIVAFIMELSILALGLFVGQKVYKSIRMPTPKGVRVAVAIIVGITVTLTALELTQSHKLIRITEKMWSSADEE